MSNSGAVRLTPRGRAVVWFLQMIALGGVVGLWFAMLAAVILKWWGLI